MNSNSLVLSFLMLDEGQMLLNFEVELVTNNECLVLNLFDGCLVLNLFYIIDYKCRMQIDFALLFLLISFIFMEMLLLD